MSAPNRQKSPQLRYWKVKLQPLSRPAFWLSGTGLSIVLLLAWQYYSNGESRAKFLQLVNLAPESGINVTKEQPEEKTQVIDYASTVEELEATLEVDNSFLLQRELNPNRRNRRGNQSSQVEVPTPDTDEVLSRFLPNQVQASSEAQSNQETNSTQDLLKASGLNIFYDNNLLGSTSSSSQSSNSLTNPSQSNFNNNSRPSSLTYSSNGSSEREVTITENPLQQALERLATTQTETPSPQEVEQASENTSESESTTLQANPLVNVTGQVTTTATTQPLLGTGTAQDNPNPTTNNFNSFTYLTQSQVNNPNPSQPGTTLPTPLYPSAVTPVPVPNSSNNFGYPQQSNAPNSTDVPRMITNPGFQRNFRSPALQPLQPVPSTPPRRIPGRYIGGGQINTFSNP